MKNAFGLAVLIVLFYFPAKAQDAVMVKNNIHTTVSDNKIKTDFYQLIQINNKDGLDVSRILIFYDDLVKIKSVTVSIYNESMYKVRSLKTKEIEDFKVYDGYFYTDKRCKKIDAVYHTYPYYIELEYTKERKEFLYLDNWIPQGNRNIMCLESEYMLDIPSDVNMIYKFYNFNPEENISVKESVKTYTWKVKDLQIINSQEKFLPDISFLMPQAIILLEDIDFGGIKGKALSWKQYGNWISHAIEDADLLPEKEINRIKSMVKDCSSDREKVQVLYKYLQDNTRYVYVGIGVEAIITHNAEYVCEKKYGDCKALSNYMKSMLSVAGIKSFYSLIRAGASAPEIDTSFLSLPFNHVVLMVPLEQDTLWLECTNQNNPFVYWGSFTNGEYALVCDYENSRLVKTPQFSYSDNSVTLNADVVLDDNQMVVKSKRILKGEAFEDIFFNMDFNNSEEVNKDKNRLIPFSNAVVDSIYFNYTEDDPYQILEHASFKVMHHIQEFGNNIIIEPFNKFAMSPISLKAKRNNDIWIGSNHQNTDTVTYHFPDGYTIVDIPQDLMVSTDFGEFKQVYLSEDSCIVVVSELKQNKGLYPKAEYLKFSAFVNVIIESKNHKILIEKQ